MIGHYIFKCNLTLNNVGPVTNALVFVPSDLCDTKVAQRGAFASLELVVAYVLRIPQRIECDVDIHAQILIFIRRRNDLCALGYAVNTGKQVALDICNVVGIRKYLIRGIFTSDGTPQFTAICHVQTAHASEVSAVIRFTEVVPGCKLRE